jgi:hypothetical protein
LRRLHPEKALAPYTEEEEDFDDCFWCDWNKNVQTA